VTFRERILRDSAPYVTRGRLVWAAINGHPIAHRLNQVGGTIEFRGDNGFVLDVTAEQPPFFRVAGKNHRIQSVRMTGAALRFPIDRFES
jgi:hypothetical protein